MRSSASLESALSSDLPASSRTRNSAVMIAFTACPPCYAGPQGRANWSISVGVGVPAYRPYYPCYPHYYYRPYPYGVPAPFVFGFGPWW